MKKLLATAVLASVALAGCASKPLNDTQAVMVEGKLQEVQVQDLRSFQVEIAPRKAVCELTNTAGETVQAECLQYRRTFDRNYNVLSGEIAGFEYETGYRYVLDLKQERFLDQKTGKVVPAWSLNKVISKTAEQ
ncbi:protein of unknown function [Moraxella cuniculi DSM 21768]|uniref:DUF4377 domain-containing protein n=1 Tax=Moraxella cuniculi DSM 21768 TaxID=1122245 RepID=A0A1N7EMX9_9GAMM|nr:DUF4377 domain-containing protein [Moraxella cuniculi]OOS07738.1 hypothetical protein B0189_02430 [Moraxella cuniculi]SIR89434.1 protein of unknown function [Moraxella cuniculi DSM 21768]